MRRWVFICMGVVVIAISCYILFSRAFSHIEYVSVEKYAKETQSFMESMTVDNATSLGKIKDILNSARHESPATYEMAHQEDYQLTITYEDGTTDKLVVWAEVGDSILLLRPEKQDAFRINRKSHQEAFLRIMNEREWGE
ncbi:hypothetical protein [Priestia taiwanensis]|uniref:YhfM-like domain-containing protein n=1 Tax=Priestia taiwanensis TaxID=1347902 RepID=A0A917AS53_9BACI|nr:hypothetical protein [Priestia taiwanensis]MBM7363951.1 hypothetical protein [Priestia taiwanensis]GGE70426.1 hypothetical protein GCM10007140_20420 [Priestia taiwanensis]